MIQVHHAPPPRPRLRRRVVNALTQSLLDNWGSILIAAVLMSFHNKC